MSVETTVDRRAGALREGEGGRVIMQRIIGDGAEPRRRRTLDQPRASQGARALAAVSGISPDKS